MGLEHGEPSLYKKEQGEDRGEANGLDDPQTGKLDLNFLINEKHSGE